MKKSEQIKQLESELQEYKHHCTVLKDYIDSLNSTAECSPRHCHGLSKTDAYDMVIRMLHTNPNFTPTLQAVLEGSEQIMEWFNKDNSPSPVDNDFKVWEELFAKWAWKFTASEVVDVSLICEQVFNEFKDQYLIIQR